MGDEERKGADTPLRTMLINNFLNLTQGEKIRTYKRQ